MKSFLKLKLQFTVTATTVSDGSEKSSTDFRWTDDELELLLKCSADFRSRKEYQEINWEDAGNKNEKINFLDQYPMEKADIERFPNGYY